jgi:hypothetical protein
LRKGSKEAKAWGRKMKRLRTQKTTKRKKTRKYTTRKRRTTRRGDLTLRRKPAYSRSANVRVARASRKRKSNSKSGWNW